MQTEPEHSAGADRVLAPAATRAPVAVPDRPLPIVLDDRERASGLLLALGRRWPRVEVTRLPVGDVQVGRVVVERKAARDFLASLADGRLFAQAARLRAAGGRQLLLLEGDPFSLVEPERALALRGAVLSLLTGFGLPVLKTRDLEATADALTQIAAQESRRAVRARDRPRPAAACEIDGSASGRGGGEAPHAGGLDGAGALERARGPANVGEEAAPPSGLSWGCRSTRAAAQTPSAAPDSLALLAGIPRVGRARAEALLARYGSIAGLLAADPADLARTPGVGPITAARLLAALWRRQPVPPER